MNDKVILITGATSGIGFATAKGLARKGAHLIITGRNRAAGEQAQRQLSELGASSVEFIGADLAAQASVHRLADEVTARHDRLHVLLNNVGGFFPAREETEDQLEATLAINHLAPFLLTQLLLPLLQQSTPARIVNVNSDAHRLAKPPLDNDPQWRQTYSAIRAYANAKLLNLLCTYEWSRVLSTQGITVNALHPGVAMTALTGNTPAPLRWLLRLSSFVSNLEKVADTSVYLASSEEVAGVTGKYFVKRKPVRSSKWSYDEVLKVNAWDLSLNLTGTMRGGRSIGSVTAPPGIASR
jgi:NAD(P)-dependent dehydrogenase (short-subunit alcohol dehydrogenase family)